MLNDRQEKREGETIIIPKETLRKDYMCFLYFLLLLFIYIIFGLRNTLTVRTPAGQCTVPSTRQYTPVFYLSSSLRIKPHASSSSDRQARSFKITNGNLKSFLVSALSVSSRDLFEIRCLPATVLRNLPHSVSIPKTQLKTFLKKI